MFRFLARRRLHREYRNMREDPVPYICAEPLPTDILEWHFVITGPERTPYEGGHYHGKLIFPPEFPFEQPSVYMITPNGRFQCNTRLHLYYSGPHPGGWVPSWTVPMVLQKLLGFMMSDSPTIGSIQTSNDTKRQLSAQSSAFNLKDLLFCQLFPDLAVELRKEQGDYTQPLSFPTEMPDGDGQHTHNIPPPNGDANPQEDAVPARRLRRTIYNELLAMVIPVCQMCAALALIFIAQYLMVPQSPGVLE